MNPLSPSASLTEALNRHWKEYFMEAAEIAALMLGTCFFGTLVYSSDSPLNYLQIPPAAKPSLMGLGVAMTTFLIIKSPFGRRTGAHFNPAVTLTFFWLRRVHRWDAGCYVTAQFIGGVLGVMVAHELLGMHLSSAPVHYLVTIPGSRGKMFAFVGEFVLAGLLMGMVLYSSNHRRLVRFTPMLVALLTIFYYTLSPSIAGYSVNPARTFSSAVFAWIWYGIWIYFSAPFLGMMTAAAIYVRRTGSDHVYCAKVFHDIHTPCPFFCRFGTLIQGQ
ncbi:MAG TPA: aquaporin [Candidatus Binataceae bacterium]|nr:aquaporin [Candidatus Binataceae bacterium]